MAKPLYFSLDGWSELELHANANEARARVQNSFEEHRREAHTDGWPELIECCGWGSFIERATETSREPMTEEDRESFADSDEVEASWVIYALERITPRGLDSRWDEIVGKPTDELVAKLTDLAEAAPDRPMHVTGLEFAVMAMSLWRQRTERLDQLERASMSTQVMVDAVGKYLEYYGPCPQAGLDQLMCNDERCPYCHMRRLHDRYQDAPQRIRRPDFSASLQGIALVLDATSMTEDERNARDAMVDKLRKASRDTYEGMHRKARSGAPDGMEFYQLGDFGAPKQIGPTHVVSCQAHYHPGPEDALPAGMWYRVREASDDERSDSDK